MQDCPLGQPTVYVETYAPELLFPVPRTMARDRTGTPANFPFYGEDIWNGYEISWLNERGKPQIAIAEFRFPCDSPFLIESKSFKLYLNSFNQSMFPSIEAVEECIRRDISKIAQTDVFVRLMDPYSVTDSLQNFSGHCLDLLDVAIDTYHVNPDFLRTGTNNVTETLYTDLLKSSLLS